MSDRMEKIKIFEANGWESLETTINVWLENKYKDLDVVNRQFFESDGKKMAAYSYVVNSED